jgi:thioredoxin-related protein
VDTLTVDSVSDFAVLSDELRASKRVLVLVIDQPGCEYCAYIYEHEIAPLRLAGEFNASAIFRRIDMTSEEPVTDFQGNATTERTFAKRYQVLVTPTLLFLGDEGATLHEAIVGVSSRDYYGYYLEKAISSARRQLN